jgi:serine/threonine protein kinase
MNAQIEEIFTDFVSSRVDKNGLEESIGRLISQDPGIAAQMRDALKRLFTQGSLDIDRYRMLTETVQRLDAEHAAEAGLDKTLFLDEETKSALASNVDVPTDRTDENGAPHGEDTITAVANRRAGMTTVTDPRTGGTVEEHKDKIGPGTVLKDRFILTERLGEGGMGVVFKAKDRLKAEAQDHNPYVAIKVLTDSFKRYSGSYIALQREASKAQRLAHPNIATVYDFDRDGETVYMTMELLQGTPLNTYIKQLPEGGLSEEAAMKMIKDMGDGLAYAHKHNLVHSDFKPGNAFLQINGTVKILDFGIARAAATDEKGEKTIFDPSKLGALTPAYATVEMFAGDPPDPRDDIYAMACVSYELLTGKHPFNKVSAAKAKGLGLKPKAIRGLSRRQNKAFGKALEFDRVRRTKSVEEFLEGITRKKTHTKKIALAAAIVIAIVTSAVYQPLMSYQQEQSTMKTIDQIKSGDKQSLINLIWTMDRINPQTRQTYTLYLRKEIIDYYRERVAQLVDEKRGFYDYPLALDHISRAKEFYPDSAALEEMEGSLQQDRAQLLEKMQVLFERYLRTEALLPTESGRDMTRIIPIVRRADPRNPLLTDPRLYEAYAKAAEKAIGDGNVKKAVDLLKTSYMLSPENPELAELESKLGEEFKVPPGTQAN